MKTELTKEQEARIVEYREKYWNQAISTDRADKPRAEAAAQKLAEIGGVKNPKIIWVSSPDEGDTICKSFRNSLSDSLRNSLWNSLSDSLVASLKHPLWNSLIKSLQMSLIDSLWNSLRDSLWNSLWNSLRASLQNSLNYSLWGSFRNSLRDSNWLCFYTYGVEILNIKCNNNALKLLKLHNEIASSCFAMWITPESVILCDRPKSVEVENGNVVDMKW
jgi:hypothetical protein